MDNYKKLEIYECNFCSKHLQNEKWMKKHVGSCFQNPRFYENICFCCKHFNKKTVLGVSKEGFYCTKKEGFLVTLRASEKYKDFQDRNIMPENCDDYELEAEKLVNQSQKLIGKG